MTKEFMPQVKNVVFLMLENRSIDNVLGWLYDGGRKPKNVFPPNSSASYDGLVEGKFFNPAYAGFPRKVKNYPVTKIPAKYARKHERVPAYNPYEEFKIDGWNGVMNQMFGNQDEIKSLPKSTTAPPMKGFLQDYYSRYMLDWQGLDILWAYSRTQLPGINKLAGQYGVSDHWYCSVPTQTNPNRAFSLCGTSLGRENNQSITAIEQFKIPTVFNALAGAGKNWGLYFTDTWQKGKCYTEYTFPYISKVSASGETGSLQKFYDRAKAGTLPDFTYLEPKWGAGKGVAFRQGTDFHPPTSVLPGDEFLVKVYNALRGSPQWKETLFIVTFDEHGGTYDHVGSKWGAINPDGKKGKSGFDFNLFGVRVPTLLISPFVKPSTVFRAPAESKYPFDHTSFIKTLLLWAGVDLGTVDFGKRMPQSPTFEGALSQDIVNQGREISQILKASPADLAASSIIVPEGDADIEPLNTDLENIDYVGARAIIEQNDSVEDMLASMEKYKKDPEKFLHDLS